MDRAIRPAMRNPLCLLPILALAACGEDATALVGHLAEGTEATHVWVLGEPARAPVEADSFRLEGLTGELLDLRFAEGDEEVARMEIRGVRPGEGLRLRGVWFDDGVAYPAAVEGPGVLTVNGLRMAGAEEGDSRQVDATGTVLAVSDEGDALLVRREEGEGADLRVVVTPGTLVRTADGDPASAEGLEFGDSVRVMGPSESGYLVATELVVPRERARSAASGRGSGAAPEPRGSFAEEESKERGKREREGRGKGKGKGKGRG